MNQITQNPPVLIGYIPGAVCRCGNTHLCMVTLQSHAAETSAAGLLPPETETVWCACDPYAAGPVEAK